MKLTGLCYRLYTAGILTPPRYAMSINDYYHSGGYMLSALRK